MGHQNRGKWNAPGRTPRPEDITRAREVAGMTQEKASDLVYTSIRTWQEWEQGRFAMPKATFELFLIKTGQSPLGILRPGTFTPPAEYRSDPAK